MLSLGPGPLRVGVLGDGSAEATLSGADSVDRSLDIEPVEPDVVTGRQGQGFHCVVVDSASGVGCPDAVEECVDACPELPVVALTNGADDGAIAALEAGADETLPATVTETAPGLLAERVVSTVEREHARDGLQEMYDGVAGGVTLHDPDTGELLHANRRACETLGYSREELRALSLEGLTGDVAGYDGERARAIVDRALRREEPVTLEWPFERADGTVRWTDSRVEAATFCSQELVLWASTDAAERHHQEYEQIFNSVNDAIAVFDPDTGEITDINDSYRAMVGYDDLETVRELGIEGLSVAEEGYTGERGQALISEVAETGDSTTVEWQAETRSGERLWLEATLAPGTVGGEQRVLSIQRDITARKRREREYEQVFNGVPDPITVNDPETGEMVAVNDAMCEAVGYDRETVLEKGVDGLSVTEEGYTSERAAEIVDRVLSSGEAETFEWKLETADGDIRVLEVTGKPAMVGGERRYISLTRDITERKRREREYEQVFNSVTDGIVVFDPEAGELTDVNDTYLEMVGYDSLEAIREVGAEGLSADGPEFTEERVDAIVDRVAETGETETVEWAVERADGERRVFEVNSTTATIGGERRVLSLNRDVTEQRRTERRLEAILERIDEAIFMTRAEEITTASRAPDYVSSGYEEIWGQPVERIRETYEEGFFATLHPDDEAGYRAFVEGVVEDIVAGDAADRYAREYRVERPDGEVRWVHSDYYPAEWETGSPRVVIVSRDITERKARERRIASFDDATDGLATADTPAEAAHTAVEAATEILDLPAVGALLYDDDEGVLRPAVTAGPLPAAAEPVGPGDGPLWEGFATGAIVAPDGGDSTPGLVDSEEPSTPAELAGLAGWRALALGNHGVLLVGSPDRSLGSETVQAAHVLAATLEAALNHLEGKQRLEAQQEQLRTQTERAERLDRIARLTQQVEAAITDASTPSEVERAVCRRLAGSGPYNLAWVGGVEVGADRLAARAVVGASDQYVGAFDLATEGTADPHPAVAAWRSDEAQVAGSLVDSGPAGGWRRRALSEGYQSLCAVPLTYDGVTHGVLTVGVESPNAFDDRERDVLAQLGTSIANALAAVERRRALESDETVELVFKGSGEALPFARAAAAADCRVRLERTASRQDGPVSVYFSFDGDVPEDAPTVARRELPGDVEVVAEESSSTLVEVRTDDWFGAPLAEYGGVLRSASAEPGETTVTVEVPTEADVRSFVERLGSVAPSLELVARRQHSRQERTTAELGDQVREALTDRQLEVLRTSLSAGYFEWPRENDGSEVAARLGITQPTLNKHLRLAERKVFSLLLDPVE